MTPIPTTGELEELSISSQDDRTVVEADIRCSFPEVVANPSPQVQPELPRHPPEVPAEEAQHGGLQQRLRVGGIVGFSVSYEIHFTRFQDGKVSPKKVHFSEIDQVKLMSQVRAPGVQES